MTECRRGGESANTTWPRYNSNKFLSVELASFTSDQAFLRWHVSSLLAMLILFENQVYGTYRFG